MYPSSSRNETDEKNQSGNNCKKRYDDDDCPVK